MFSPFVLGWNIQNSLPQDLLGRLTDADFLQQIGKNLETRGKHVAGTGVCGVRELDGRAFLEGGVLAA